MNPRTLRLATLAAALSACTLMALVGCSRRADGVLSPIRSDPAVQAQANVPPDTWFAGPDPDDRAAGWQTATGRFGGSFIPIADWSGFRGVKRSMLDDDSLHRLPSDRPERKTFFEAYNNRLWLRHEGDTVHLNSWVILPSGGSDPDSPYGVRVNTALLPPGPLRGSVVLRPSGPNGSPIGFRLRIQQKDASGQILRPSETTTYPAFDPTSVFHFPVINGYWGLTWAGKAYAVVRAEDGDGTVDRRVDQQPGDAVGIADRVDAGGGSAEDRALRSKILTFYVNHPPVLDREQSQFRPLPNQAFPSRVLRPGLDLNLLASDDDPLDPLFINPVGGTPPYPPILRRKVAILGKYALDPTRDTCYVASSSSIPNPAVTIPSWIASGNITILVRLCDCDLCDVLPAPPTCSEFAGHEPFASMGTCVDTAIPCRLNAP